MRRAVDPKLEARTVTRIARIEAAAWDRLAPADNPFLSHAFLDAAEASRSATEKTGWQPFHLTLESGGRLIGVAPLYVKSHSYGEYVFDHGWAEGYRRAGGSYYPKLLVAVPFTPVPGLRLLAEDEAARAALIESLKAVT
ncbi:MAG: peptidogalycan biosysnthesis protein, partial [Geminicoccaceae bacterium]